MVLPRNVELTPHFIRIQWDDGHVSLFGHRYLRGNCRCAGCVNELTGRRVVGVQQVPADVQALDWMQVGRYALQFLWSDGHDTGIYPFTALRDEMCPCEDCRLRREAAGRGIKADQTQ
jgi:DUF971 family protein